MHHVVVKNEFLLEIPLIEGIMANSRKCPICGREGIPDYLKEDVTCPDCGSNLRAFRIIDRLEQEANSKTTIWKPLGIVAMVAALLFALLYFTKGSMPTADKERLSILEDSIATLNDMIKEGGAPTLAQNATVAATAAKENKDAKDAKEANKEKTSAEQKSETAATPAAAPAEKPAEKASEEVKETPAATGGITAPNDMVTVRNGKKYYTVKKGDSWWKISGKLYNHKVSDAELARMNGKDKNKPIDVGQQILVK